MTNHKEEMEHEGEKFEEFAREEISHLAGFEKVRSEADCIAVLTATGLLGDTGLDRVALGSLQCLCQSMRSKGMAMEPNLFGRAVARNILDRTLAGIISKEYASCDTDFLDLIAAADAAREREDYSEAKTRYFQALQMFPFHPGYMLQYGHCLKELKLLPEALVAYFDAYRFGATKEEFEIHASDTARQLGRSGQVSQMATKINPLPTDKPLTSLDLELTSMDVITLTQLFHLNTPSPENIANRLCFCRSRRELILALLAEPQFFQAHRNTLRLVSEIGLK
jgi:tetratricopeptide (TPR) repeat protein